MLSSNTITGIILVISSIATALPTVTVNPLENDCSSYPSYNPTTKTAGPWEVIADSTNTSFDGFNVSAETFTNNGIDQFGFVTVPKTADRFNPSGQSLSLRCTNSNTSLPSLQAYVQSQWIDLFIASLENWQASFSFGMPEAGIPVQPYAHFVDGTRVPGVFLGTRNSTSWKYKFNWGGNAGEYFILRWLQAGEGKVGMQKRQDFPVIDDRDYVGFLKVLG